MLKGVSNKSGCNNSSGRLQILLSGINAPSIISDSTDTRNSLKIPDWFDKELFQQGRKFYKNYFFCLVFSELLGLVILSSFKRLLLPLIFTQKSDTPGKALRRYMSTVTHIIAWFEEDVFDPTTKGYEDIMRVRAIHLKVYNQINQAPDDVQKIQEDMENYLHSECPFGDFFQDPSKNCNLDRSTEITEYFSQYDMVITQYCFIGLAITHPNKIGLHWVGKKDMESLIHFWRGIGWLLGIEDCYNLCTGTMEEVRSLCLDIERSLVITNLTQFTLPSYNNVDTIMKGINKIIPAVSYPSMYLYTLTIFNIPGFGRYISWKHFSYYLLMRVVFGFLFRIPYCINIFNRILRYAVRLFNKRVNPSS